jgi:hypothetical protein
MPSFRVLVEGKDIRASVGHTSAVGFFTTRAVRANSANEAAEKVTSMLIHDWTSGRYASWNGGQAPTLSVQNVWHTSWFKDLFFINDGHTFYTSDDEHEDEA